MIASDEERNFLSFAGCKEVNLSNISISGTTLNVPLINVETSQQINLIRLYMNGCQNANPNPILLKSSGNQVINTQDTNIQSTRTSNHN